jgi:lipoate-protein ligase A
VAETIRLLPLALASGPRNMALDESILDALARGDVPPTVRFYGWRGRWLSIGMSESIADVGLEACRAAGVRVLRRPSGGTAVLHVEQIGWALLLPSGHRFAPVDILESYALHAAITLDALATLGVHARPSTAAEARAPLPDELLAMACFGGLAPHEVVVGDPPRKLVGWGQVRRRGVVMHHSAVSLRFDAAALASLLATDRARLAAALRRRVIGLDEAAGRPVARRELVEAVVAALGRAGLAAVAGELSCAERRRADELVRTKFADERWTVRR